MEHADVPIVPLVLLHEAHGSKKIAPSAYFDSIHHTKFVTDQVFKSLQETAELTAQRLVSQHCYTRGLARLCDCAMEMAPQKPREFWLR